MNGLRSLCAWLTLGLACVGAYAQSTQEWLTPEEQAWIRDHPVLRVAVGPHTMPVEYLRGGKLQGLSAEYLGTISRLTGLAFIYAEGDDSQIRLNMLNKGEVDLVSAARSTGGWPRAAGIAYTTPYHISAVITVTRANQPVIFDLSELNGKRIAISASSTFRPLLARHVPDSPIVTIRSAKEALEKVADGSVDATVGTQTYLAPYLQRQYEGVLQISGVINGMTSEISMAVRDSDALLYSIVQKSLASITPDQGLSMQRNWLATTEHDILSMRVFFEHYVHEFVLAGLVLALLLGLMWQAHRQRRRAWRSEREKAMFLAVMSHEIRSPMNAVLAAVELLRYTRLDERQRHFADLANSGANTLLRLLDDVLDISKLEAGKLSLHLEPVDLPALVRDVVDLHQLRATEKGIALTLDMPPDPGLLMLDASRLAQILHNLVSNAIKFTDNGGIDVRISLTDNGHGCNRQLDIVVTDSGIGIAEAEQARLFRPYSQTDSSYKSSGGTGLGLAICRELATLMHGAIALRSTPGEGTIVTVTLPVSPAAPQASPTLQEPTQAPMPSLVDGRDVHILIVEDSPANQEVLAEQVRSFGCQPHLARDGAEALAQFEAREFDLVLLDCHLPDTDGYTLAGALRAHETKDERAACAIIAISASTGNEHVEHCFAAGMDGVLSKPIRVSRLRDTIELWCGVTVADAPTVDDEAHGLSPDRIRSLMADDVAALLGALVLDDSNAGMRAAHRVRGAALTLGWTDMALAAGTLEDLLRAGVEPTPAAMREAQQALARCWRDICEAQRQTTSATPS